MGKVAFDAELGSELFVTGILGPVVQGQRPSTGNRKIPESLDDRLIGLCSSLPVKFGYQDNPTLTLDQCI